MASRYRDRMLKSTEMQGLAGSARDCKKWAGFFAVHEFSSCALFLSKSEPVHYL
jgi:hypothetical protein